ncbi:MAG: hypothetical protein IKH57_23775 [Clostridia bacterium]|nr:hypothetical protein [Clostridia bacterium]
MLFSDDDVSVMETPLLWPLGAPDEDLIGLPPALIISAANCPFRFQNEELGKDRVLAFLNRYLKK